MALPDRRIALAALLAVLLPSLLYLPSLGYGFVFDDRPLLIENPVVQSPRGLAEIFTTDLDPQSRLQDAPTTNYLRPLFLAFASGLYAAFGAAPFGWHLAAVILHGLLGGLAFWLLRREGLGTGAAFAAALLFTAHPSHVQSAAWVSGLQDLLFGVLAIGAYLVYRASADRPQAGRGTLSLLGAAYAVALLAKEPAIGLLLFVAAESVVPEQLRSRTGQSLGPGSRRPWAELAMLTVVTSAYLAYRWSVLGEMAHRFPTAPPWPEALASVPVAVLAYARDLLLPVDLFLLHPARPVTSWMAAPALGALAGVAVLVALAVWAARRRPALGRPLLWSAAWLAPTLAVWAVNPEWMVMDRYLLLPSLGLAWALALALPLPDAGRWRLGWQLAAATLIAACAGLTLGGMQDLRDESAFWRAAIRADPGSSTAWAEWGRLRLAAGDLAGASEALDRAVELDPQALLPRLRRASLALRRGQAPAAVAELEGLIERNPAYLPAWRNLVVAQERTGEAATAVQTLERALLRFPGDALLWTQRAVLLRAQGRREEALAAIRRAASLAPNDASVALREALLLAELGRPEDAVQAARRGLALAPAPELRASLEPLAR